MSGDEVTKGGSTIFRHVAPAGSDGVVAEADLERIQAHLEAVLGPCAEVLHEIVSDRVHIDVLVFRPTGERPFQVLVTCGMSARAMAVPKGVDDPQQWAFAELCVLLPASWPMDRESWADERHYWPIRLLKGLARLPHDFGTWLSWGHTVPNGDPAEPFAEGTVLCAAAVLPPYGLPPEVFVLKGDPPVKFFQVVPLYEAEMDLKLDRGLEVLLERLEHVENAFGPIDPKRLWVA